MNEVIKTILQRRAVRKYEDRPVSREDLELIVKCGHWHGDPALAFYRGYGPGSA